MLSILVSVMGLTVAPSIHHRFRRATHSGLRVPSHEMVSPLLAQYGALLSAHPVVTNAVTAGLLAVSGDAVAQSREKAPYDIRRGCTFVAFNTAYRGGFQLLAFPALFAICQGRAVSVAVHCLPCVANDLCLGQFGPALERMLVNQVLIVPTVYYPFFFLLSGWLQQLGPRQTLLRARANWRRLVLKNWLFWMPVNLVQFAVLPLRWQVTVSCMMGFIWNVILSIAAGNVQVPVEKESQDPPAGSR